MVIALKERIAQGLRNLNQK